MSDYFEIDFLPVGEGERSGDAIAMRYSLLGKTTIHVVDGGFQQTGNELVEHIKKYYNDPSRIDPPRIDYVVLTHPHKDHAGGLKTLFENFEIGELWMLRPWKYADELGGEFNRFTSVKNLKKHLRGLYPNIVALEELAKEKDVSIKEPFQGAKIGDFTVLSPSKCFYIDLLEGKSVPETVMEIQAKKVGKKVVNFVKTFWGKEIFPPNDTSPKNNMSVVQYAQLCGKKILLTGDAGRAALERAIAYAPKADLVLRGVDRIQIPHHGSRHNVSSEILDYLLGPKFPSRDSRVEKFTAIASVAEDDKDHPRKAVVRAFFHRGAKVLVTREKNIYCRSKNAPRRDENWSVAEEELYPKEQEGL